MERQARDAAELGQAIASAREAAGLTQGDVAASIEVDQPTFSRIERGERGVSAAELHLIAGAVGVITESLLLKPETCGTPILLRAGDADAAGLARTIKLIDGIALDHARMRSLVPPPAR